MKEKNKNVVIIIFIITTIIAAGVAVYFGLKCNNLNNELALKQESKEEVASKNDAVENEQKEQSEENKVTEKVTKEYATNFDVNADNCLNKQNDNVIYSKGIYLTEDTAYGLSCTVQSDKRKLRMSILCSTFNNRFNQNIGSGLLEGEYTFDKNIVKLYFGGAGNGFPNQSEAIFCVLEDGTVYCMNVYNAAINNNFNSFVKLDGLSNIIDIGEILVNSKTEPGGYGTVAAFNKDGKFYDLTVMLREKGIIK